jgi:hypothetical protein
MRSIEATTTIAAPPDEVWKILVDGARYGEWNPFITSLSGDITPGSRVQVRIRPPGGRPMTFRPVVTHASLADGLRWNGHLLIPGLCDGTHEFLLAKTSDGGTRLTQQETFRGLMVPMLGGMMKPTLLGFEAMHAALQRRVDSSAERC